MPSYRKYPHGSEQYSALGSDWWSRVLDISQKVAVYWTGAADAVTLVGYYDTVSEANTAAVAAVNASGAYPRVSINWYHPDITHRQLGPVAHPDAAVDLPAWIDAEPAT